MGDIESLWEILNTQALRNMEWRDFPSRWLIENTIDSCDDDEVVKIYNATEGTGFMSLGFYIRAAAYHQIRLRNLDSGTSHRRPKLPRYVTHVDHVPASAYGNYEFEDEPESWMPEEIKRHNWQHPGIEIHERIKNMLGISMRRELSENPRYYSKRWKHWRYEKKKAP